MASNEKCGDVFLTEKGVIVFHCVLCGRKYGQIENYGIHIIDKHYTPEDDFDIDDLLPDFSDILEQNDSSEETLNDFHFETDDEESNSDNDSQIQMDETELEDAIQLDKQCGEVEITPEGMLLFNCTLCISKYEGIREFDQHVIFEHSTTETEVLEEVQFEMLSYENDKDNTNDGIDSNIDYEFIIEQSQDNEDSSAGNDKNVTQVSSEKKSNRPVSKFRQVFESVVCPLTNKESFKCKLCGVVIRDKSNCPHHIKRVHEHLKPHKCSECPKKFFSRTELKIHFRNHTGERPYLCMECGMSFVSASVLHRHREVHHKKQVRDKICRICDKSFYTTKHLQAHQSVHSEERPFQCQECSAGFKKKTTLRTHMRIHEDKRQYKCNLCAASYNYKSILTAHMKSKHSIAPQTA